MDEKDEWRRVQPKPTSKGPARLDLSIEPQGSLVTIEPLQDFTLGDTVLNAIPIVAFPRERRKGCIYMTLATLHSTLQRRGFFSILSSTRAIRTGTYSTLEHGKVQMTHSYWPRVQRLPA